MVRCAKNFTTSAKNSGLGCHGVNFRTTYKISGNSAQCPGLQLATTSPFTRGASDIYCYFHIKHLTLLLKAADKQSSAIRSTYWNSSMTFHSTKEKLTFKAVY